MNDILILPDGSMVGTGLQTPVSLSTAFPVYEDVGPMLTDAQIEETAKSGAARGKGKFGDEYIKNQQSKGSCNGHAAAEALERARVRRGLTRVGLSGAYLYSLINRGRDNGSMLDDGMAALVEKGCATDATVRWDQIYPSLYDKAKADAEAAKYKAMECYAVRTRQALFSALVLGFDCVVAVHADNGFMQLDADQVAGGGNGLGNHAVLCDGLYWSPRRNRPVGDGVNSWGLSYGDRGRMGLDWNSHFAPTTQYHVLYAVRTTIDGGDSLPPAA